MLSNDALDTRTQGRTETGRDFGTTVISPLGRAHDGTTLHQIPLDGEDEHDEVLCVHVSLTQTCHLR